LPDKQTPKIGDIAPEINLPAVDRSKSYKLSELRGKMVLIYFWASFAPPCRFENDHVVRIYNKYKDKSFKNAEGFTVYAVSLDRDVEKWKAAIKKDNMQWPYHVSDMKSYESEVVNNYGIINVPFNFLIDGSGKVIAINLKSPDLANTIEKHLK
ncbi:MAG: TlpA family protein disulfide reductase, partial [Parachlamydiales bacterium]|nr:TlpA family protein disulfide reductase [Parachlamydiales bacterium]